MIVYLGTIVACFLGNCLVFLKIAKDVENQGYKFKKKKRNIFNEILAFIKIFLFSAIPLGNLFISGILIFKSEELSQKFISEGLEDGTLLKKEQNEKLKIKEEFEFNTDNYVESKVEVYKVNETQRNQMTREEKIAFLKEEYERLTEEKLKSKLDEIINSSSKTGTTIIGKKESVINDNLGEKSNVVVYRVATNKQDGMTREEKIAFLKEEYNRLTGKELVSNLDHISALVYGMNQ